MKRIILLRFHKDLEIVQNRIDILHHFNSELQIYGLFGGNKDELTQYRKNLHGLEHIHFLNITDREIKWKFSDVSILRWYQEFGRNLDFDILYTIEYDLVILSKLTELVPVSGSQIALTGLINLSDIREKWDWLTDTPHKEESQEFMTFMRNNYSINSFFACLAPGAVLNKSFLDAYAQATVPLIGHDELRLPQLAQAFDQKLVDTGFYDNWNSANPETEQYFNCNNNEVLPEVVYRAYRQGIRKVFHPVYKPIDLAKIL